MNENQILKEAKEALDKAVDEARRNKNFLSTIGASIIEVIRPVLEKISDNARLTKEDMQEAISRITIEAPKVDVPHAVVDVKIPEIKVPKPEVTVMVPEIKVPAIKIPAIKVPRPEVTVTVPPIKIPKIEVPKFDFPNDLEVSLKNEFDYKNPLPVILMDNKGNPYRAIVGGSGGESSRILTPLLSDNIRTGQATISVTGTAVQLPEKSLINGMILSALSTNASTMVLGTSSIPNVKDGTGTGYLLEAGNSVSFAVDNANKVYINGAAGDIVSFAGS